MPFILVSCFAVKIIAENQFIEEESALAFAHSSDFFFWLVFRFNSFLLCGFSVRVAKMWWWKINLMTGKRRLEWVSANFPRLLITIHCWWWRHYCLLLLYPSTNKSTHSISSVALCSLWDISNWFDSQNWREEKRQKALIRNERVLAYFFFRVKSVYFIAVNSNKRECSSIIMECNK